MSTGLPPDDQIRPGSDGTRPPAGGDGGVSPVDFSGSLNRPPRFETDDPVRGGESRMTPGEAPDDAVAGPNGVVDGPLAGPPITRIQYEFEPERPPGPGLLESIGWTGGMFFIHIVGAVIATFGLMATLMTSQPELMTGSANSASSIKDLSKQHMMKIMAGEMTIFLAVAVFCCLLRLGPDRFRKLGVRRISLNHLLLILGVTIPLSVLCGGLHSWLLPCWEHIAKDLPSWLRFEGADINETLKPLGQATPLWALLLVIAVMPALGEELVFRGVIGRGLVARYGIVAGVAMTSLLFALVHTHPAHVVSLLPLAVFLHLAYLVTRSFWAPVLLHLTNNALAAVTIKAWSVSENDPAVIAGAPESIPAVMILGALVLTLPVGIALWKSRIEFSLPDGTIWTPGYPTASLPPDRMRAEELQRECHPALMAFAICIPGMFSAFLILAMWLQLSGLVPIDPGA